MTQIGSGCQAPTVSGPGIHCSNLGATRTALKMHKSTGRPSQPSIHSNSGRRSDKAVHDPLLVSLGVAILIIGMLYYLFLRSPQHLAIGWVLAWLPDWTHASNRSDLDQWIGWAPTFFHVSAFSLISAGIINHPRLAVLAWVAINLGFEAWQGPTSTGSTANQSPFYWFFGVGTYAADDLFAAFGGGLFAYMIILARNNNRGNST